MPSRLYNENGLNVQYVFNFIEKTQADEYLKQLKTLPFYTPSLKIRGRNAKPTRQMLAYGDPNTSYAFSGTCIQPERWSSLMIEIRDLLEKHTDTTFNFVLLNYFGNGFDFIRPHKDNEKILAPGFPTAVLSFGAERTIEFKRPKFRSTRIRLQHGSLYIMEKPTNEFYTYGIEVEAFVRKPRISLTFHHLIPTPALPLKKPKLNESSENPPTCGESSTFKDPTFEEEPLQSSAKQPDPVPNDFPPSSESLAFRPDQAPIDFPPSSESCAFRPDQAPSDCISSTHTSPKQEELIANRCLTDPFKEQDYTNSLIAEWNLNRDTFLQIMLDVNFKLRVHIRNFKPSPGGEWIPSKQGVVMTPCTFIEFIEKLRKCTFASTSESFISNNQLLTVFIDSEKCLLQQIFALNTSGFYLKPRVLTLSRDQFAEILEYSSNICEHLIEVKFLKQLPALIENQSTNQCDKLLCDSHSAEEHFFNCIMSEIHATTVNLFKCDGCIHELMFDYKIKSQFRHDCMMISTHQKFQLNSTKILLQLNIQKVVDAIVKKCTCHYNHFFFSQLDMAFFMNYIESKL